MKDVTRKEIVKQQLLAKKRFAVVSPRLVGLLSLECVKLVSRRVT